MYRSNVVAGVLVLGASDRRREKGVVAPPNPPQETIERGHAVHPRAPGSAISILNPAEQTISPAPSAAG